MTYILNIETATPICSVSLAKDGKVLDCIENHEGQTHAELLTVFIEQILERNQLHARDLSAVAVSSGPGSYTGLRIGVSVAKGICYGRNIPLITVPTLQAMAWGVAHKNKDGETLLCPMIDARRMEVYMCVFNADLKEIKETQPLVVEKGAFQDLLAQYRILFFGTGAQKCQAVIESPNAIFLDDLSISAKNMGQLSYDKFKAYDIENVAYYEPFYLKEYQAVKSNKDVLA